MCWRQFEDVIPLLADTYDVYAVSFDGFDGTGETTYTTAQAIYPLAVQPTMLPPVMVNVPFSATYTPPPCWALPP